jgi:hypothetical protein
MMICIAACAITAFIIVRFSLPRKAMRHAVQLALPQEKQ